MKKLLCILLLVVLPACGYQLARTGSGTGNASGKYKVSIPMFKNDSWEPLVEKDVTDALKEEIALDGRWVITDNGDADILVNGKVTRVDLQPLSYDPQERVLEYRLRMHMDVKVSDIKTGKVIWKKNDFTSFADYRVTVDVTKSKIRKSEAIKYASKRFAEEFIIRVLDTF
ncbi:MAG: LptE family protein [Nitrospirota bacterium]